MYTVIYTYRWTDGHVTRFTRTLTEQEWYLLNLQSGVMLVYVGDVVYVDVWYLISVDSPF